MEAAEEGKQLEKQVNAKIDLEYKKCGPKDEDVERERREGEEREKKEEGKVEKKDNEKYDGEIEEEDEAKGVKAGKDADEKDEERKHSNDKETENAETKTAIQAEQYIEAWDLPLMISKEDMGHTLILNTRTGKVPLCLP